MNLFAIVINSEMHYFVDTQNSKKSHLLDEYIASYHIQNSKNTAIFDKLLADIKQDLNLVLTPIKLIDIYRPYTE